MTKTLSLAAVLAIMGTGAMADAFTNQIVADLQAKGFTTIEIENGRTQTKAEAILNNQKVEVVWDRTTGSILSQTWEAVSATETSRDSSPDSPATVRDSRDDFLTTTRLADGTVVAVEDDRDGMDDDRDGNDDINGRTHDGADDNGVDDDHGGVDDDHSGAGDDDGRSDDDHGSAGSSDDSGSDDHGSDDSGSHDSSSDDRGSDDDHGGADDHDSRDDHDSGDDDNSSDDHDDDDDRHDD